MKRLWTSLKIALVLNLVYPRKSATKKVRSILPGTFTLGEGAVIEENVIFTSALRTIGRQVYIGRNTYIGFCSDIGHFCSISFDVKIGLVSHPLNYVSTSPAMYNTRRGIASKTIYNDQAAGHVSIGHDVLISAGAMILAGVKIGTGAVIGAGAVVNKDVPPYAIVAGVPAKIIRYRFDDATIQELLKSEWWNASEEQLKKTAHLSSEPHVFLKALKNS
ncbi:MAG: hypothetical protein Fur0041_22810 [Bacteroidia bacterium]